jgi:hypothetical protein
MKTGAFGRFMSAIVVAIACLGSAAAQAQTAIGFGPFSINCTGVGQVCTPPFSTSVATTGLLQLSYTASPGHCSDVRVRFFVDGVERGVTAFLTAGQSSGAFDVGPVTPGTHTISLQGEGRVSGCNAGTLANWGGTAQAIVGQDIAAAAAVPAPGILATALFFLLGAFAFRRWR